MRSQLRVVLFCACFFALLSLHPSIAQEQKDQKKEIPPAIAQEMLELQTILSAHPNDPAALFNLAMDYATIGTAQERWNCWKGWPRRIPEWIPKHPPGVPSRTLLMTLDFYRS
jgi:hypothetical protein